MLQSIRTAFVDHISEVTWMDEETRTKAIDKADAIIQKIGYPDILDDAGKLDQYYENVRVRKTERNLSSIQLWQLVVLTSQVYIQSTSGIKTKTK